MVIYNHVYSPRPGADTPTLGLDFFFINCDTVMILSFWTDRSGQTVQTQIRLLLEEQSDQGLHCLLFHLHILAKYAMVLPLCLNFR